MPTCQETRLPFIASHFNLNYKQCAVRLLSWPPPVRGSQFLRASERMAPALEPMALLKKEGQRYGVQTGPLRRLRRGSGRAGQPSIQRSERSWLGAQLHQHNYGLPGGMFAGLQSTAPGPSLKWLPIVWAPENPVEGYRRQEARLRMWLQTADGLV